MQKVTITCTFVKWNIARNNRNIEKKKKNYEKIQNRERIPCDPKSSV